METKFIFNLKDLCGLKKYNKSFKDIQITNVSTINNPKDNTLIFSKTWSQEVEEKLKNIKNSLILIKKNNGKIANKIIESNECIFTDNPRQEYTILINYILSKQIIKEKKYKHLDCGAIIGEDVNIGKESKIEPFVFIDHNTCIGENCIIKTGACIAGNVIIGNDTTIGKNSVVGGEGFGIEKDADGVLITMPQIGGVIIGNNVRIGNLTTVSSGTIEPTIIEDYVKIDDHVHIAHNVHIEKNCIITACSEISGSVYIKENTWLGPNCSIINGITIGKNVLIGMGAVIRKSTRDNVIVAGKAAKQYSKV